MRAASRPSLGVMAIEDLAAPVTAPIGWAKARPLAFFFFFLIVVLLVIRFRDKIAALLARIPVVGKWLTGITHTGAPAAALALFGALSFGHVTHFQPRESTPHVALVTTVHRLERPMALAWRGDPPGMRFERTCAHA